MKKFMFLSFGFAEPSPEIMQAWGEWFESVKDNVVEQGGPLSGGREISETGTQELPLGLDSITGYTILKADSLDDAEKMAQSNPFITSVRVYEIMSM